MSNKSQHNPFKDLKSEFQSESHKNMGWNEPPSFVFDNAMETIEGINKNKRRRKLGFFLVTFLLMVALLFSYYSHSKLSSLEDKVNQLESITENESNGHAETEIKILKEPNISPAAITQAKEAKTNIIATPTIQKTKSNEVKNVHNEILTESPMLSVVDATQSFGSSINQKVFVSETDQDRFSNKVLNIDREEISLNKSFLDLQDLGTNVIDLRSEQTRILPSPQVISIVSHKLSQQRLLYVIGRQNLSGISMNGSMMSNADLKGYDKLYAGYGLGLGFSGNLTGRLGFDARLAYDRISSKSNASVSIAYQKGDEQLLSAGVANYELSGNSIPTPMGMLDQNSSMIVDPSHTSDGEELIQNSSIAQNFSTLSFAVGPTVSIIERNRFTFSAGTLLGLNYILSSDHNVYSEYYMNTDMVSNHDYSDMTCIGLNDFYGVVEFNSRLSYDLSENIGLIYNFNYSRSITDLTSSSVNSTTHLSSWFNSLGISRRF